MFILWLAEGNELHIIGQYHTYAQAKAISRDYERRGLRTKIEWPE